MQTRADISNKTCGFICGITAVCQIISEPSDHITTVISYHMAGSYSQIGEGSIFWTMSIELLFSELFFFCQFVQHQFGFNSVLTEYWEEKYSSNIFSQKKVPSQKDSMLRKSHSQHTIVQPAKFCICDKKAQN